MSEVRLHIELEGKLQGVGFRPMASRLAQEFSLSGWVKNTSQGVSMELQGELRKLEEFSWKLEKSLPAPAAIRTRREIRLETLEEITPRRKFEILASSEIKKDAYQAEILPDLSICESCKEELADPLNRRFRYPFLHCSECGPRYSLQENIPFDRENTTMRDFPLCDPCLAEFRNPSNRRYHCQGICCEQCGPAVSLTDTDGKTVANRDAAILLAAKALRDGKIIAMKGGGGFHLLCDARNELAVLRLREAKQRNAKPFALLFPSLEMTKEFCQVSSLEEATLLNAASPIVLLKRKRDVSGLSPLIAPGLNTLGVMLPYSAQHILLLQELGFPLVATSGNLASEPICAIDSEAISQLQNTADFFLTHNREIYSRIDDSIVQVVAGTAVVLRAGRGYAPFVLSGSQDQQLDMPSFLALGSQQKNALAFSDAKGRMVLLPHLGNLESIAATDEFHRRFSQTRETQGLQGSILVSDLHPDYHSTRYARETGSTTVQVQHHEAHLLSCVAEHQITGPIFGIAWDGTGYGSDASIWGGEFFQGSELGFTRSSHLRTFKLPGGEAAIREPWRAALGLLHEIFPEDATRMASDLGWNPKKVSVMIQMLKLNLHSPLCTSAGRLFDGVAALLGFDSACDYEGQAAVELEAMAWEDLSDDFYPMDRLSTEVLNWEPWIRGILEDLQIGMPKGKIAAKFHRTLAKAIEESAKAAGIRQVVLSGGCFQNRLLLETTISDLKKSNFLPFWNQNIPPNDGGLAIGQLLGGRNVLIRSR